MAKTREIVKRRKAIRNIRKITRTMELIATSKFQRTLKRAQEADAFTRKIAELAADLADHAGELEHPLLKPREKVGKVLFLVICSNRGLCGGYNAGIIREAASEIRQYRDSQVPIRLELVGKRIINWCRFQGIPSDAAYTHFEDKPRFEEVDVLASKYLDMYIRGEVDRVVVSYSKFINAARQIAVVETLLPLTSVPGLETEKNAEKHAAGVEYEFLPSPAEILQEILPLSFKIRLFKCFLDAAVSEQIARRVAMKAATENAGEIIRSLSLQYNRARQAQITKEISEIIGGVEALK